MSRVRVGFVCGVWVLLVFVVVFRVVLNVPLAGGSGTIYIRTDGSIDPSTAPIFSSDNITYIFTDNIYDEIVVRKGSIIIDGEGYTLQGAGSGNGFYLDSGYPDYPAGNVTIRNTRITSFQYGILGFTSWYNTISENTIFGNDITGNEYGLFLFYTSSDIISENNITNNSEGIYLEYSSNDTIYGNNITNNGRGIYLSGENNTISRNNITNNGNGVYLSGISYPCDNNTVFDNRITNNNYGVFLGGSSNNNIFKNNSMVGNRYGFGVFDSYVQDVDTSNTIDGKPIRYLFNQNNLVINPSTFPDIGYLALINSDNITIEGLELKNNGEGILFVNTTNSRILNNNIANNSYGVYLAESSYNTLYGNNITNSDNVGVYLSWLSDNNTIFHNNFMNNTEQAWTDGEYMNSWDNGYSYGGNYWSDYTGVDVKSGPAQDQPGSDGIGDTPYNILYYGSVVDEDHYPLMSPWPSEPELQVTLKAPTRLPHESSTLLEAAVFNRGLSNETDVNLFLFINDTIVNSTTISLVESGSSYAISYMWTPTIEGLFNVTAYAPPLPRETFFANNRETAFVNTRTPVHNTNTGLDYFTIQEAIDAPETLEGHTLTVESGTYYEHVVLNKSNLTLIGEDPSTTIIDGNGTGDVADIHTNNVTLSNFTIQNGSNGIYIHTSLYNTISGSIITNNTLYGVYIASSSNNVFRNDSLVDNKYNFYVEGAVPADYIHDVDESNLVDGKPMYYWVNRQNMTVPSDAGYVALVNCYNMTIRGLELRNNGQGVLFAETTDSQVINNTITNSGTGVYIFESSNNSVSGNDITNNGGGVSLSGSYNNVSGNYITNNGNAIGISGSYNNVFANDITNNNGTGISVAGYTSGPPNYYTYYSSNNVVSENNITNNSGEGIDLFLASSNTILKNRISNNDGTGVSVYGYRIYDSSLPWPYFYFIYSSNNIICENYMTNNGAGVSLSLASSNTVSKNNITNSYTGVYILYRSSSNTISYNNISNNQYGVDFAGGWASNNVLYANNISYNSVYGVFLREAASSNMIYENNIANNGEEGIYSSGSPSGNKIYHNNLIDNGENAWVYPGGYANTWDDGYPSGGNYWSNYTGIDVKSGPNQDQPGSDGIGDTPYLLTGGNIDHYPLMSPWPSGPGLHDLEVNLNSPAYLPPGNSTLLEATVRNNGFINEENVTLSLSIDGNIVNSTTIPLFETGASYTINYLWTPTAEGQANVTAYATPVLGEIMVENNRKTIFVTISVNPPVQNTNTGLYYYTIQEAIGAPETLDGHTIRVKAGIYYGQVTISKSLKIIGEDMTNTIIDGNKTGIFVVEIDADYVVFSGFTIQNSAPIPAIKIYGSNNVISNNTLTNNGVGIYAFDISNNTIQNNIITNSVYGIDLEGAYANTFKNNTISNHQQAGIYLIDSTDNIFTNNVIRNNKDAIVLIASNNKIYHNNFIDNTSPGFGGTNQWDDGYPSGGNYWSDYVGTDLFSGPYQNETGSDGIGDTPYAWWPDRYPLMNPIGSPQPPIAIFTYMPAHPIKGASVIFDASTSDDRDGSITTYKWNFGDGNTTTVDIPTITHIYAAEGTYTVNLTVTDNDGLRHSTTKSMKVVTDSTPPTTIHNYNGSWHTSDFTINLTATDDLSGLQETYYKLNDGPTKTVSTDGQPLITTESASNKLEYWSVDKVGNEESHHILTGIKLDKTTPTGTIVISNGDIYTRSASVPLTLTANDTTSGIDQVRFSNDGTWDTEPWQSFSQTKTWTLTSGDGTKTVYYQIKDNAELTSETYSDTINLDTTAPATGNPSRNPARDVQPDQPVKVSLNVTDVVGQVKNVTLYYTLNNGTTWEEPISMNLNSSTNLYEAAIPGQQAGTWVKYKIIAYDYAGNNATLGATESYYTYQVVPELSLFVIAPLFTTATLLIAIAHKRKHGEKRKV